MTEAVATAVASMVAAIGIPQAGAAKAKVEVATRAAVEMGATEVD